jgi:hypothetical protein
MTLHQLLLLGALMGTAVPASLTKTASLPSPRKE